jgi:2-oxo-3-hexenedioate decarboxylase
MNLKEIANEIHNHQKNALELDKITTRYSGLTLDDAYNIQKMITEKDLQAGDSFVGWKMGLTSLAKQQSVGVNQSIYGRLLKSMQMTRSDVSLKEFIHPRMEPEFAFLINKKLEGANLSEQVVWDATECVMPAVEIIDSRYRDFSFNLIDVVADNASSARFIISDQSFPLYKYEWEKLIVTMKVNGKVIKVGKGSDVMGHPVRSVVELVKMLHTSGLALEPGMIVLTGGITEAIPLLRGDVISAEFDQLGTIVVNAR